MGNGGQTVGIWIGEDEDLVNRFDEQFNEGTGTYSRSEEIKAAMDLAIAIDQTLEDAGYGNAAAQEKRHIVQQAIRDMARREGL